MSRLKRRGADRGVEYLTLLLQWSFALMCLLFIGHISTMALILRCVNETVNNAQNQGGLTHNSPPIHPKRERQHRPIAEICIIRMRFSRPPYPKIGN